MNNLNNLHIRYDWLARGQAALIKHLLIVATRLEMRVHLKDHFRNCFLSLSVLICKVYISKSNWENIREKDESEGNRL